MKTNLAHLAMAFFALGAILCTSCSKNIEREEVRFTGGLFKTLQSYIPVTGTIVEKYKHPKTGESITRKIEVNEGKIENVKDFIKGKQLFKDAAALIVKNAYKYYVPVAENISYGNRLYFFGWQYNKRV